MQNLTKFLIEIIDRRIKKYISKLKIKNTIYAQALSETDSNGFVDVDIGNGEKIQILNKSAEHISSGDTVIIEYLKNISSGCIIRRTGKAIYDCFVVVDTEEQATTDYISDRLYIVLEEKQDG